MNRNKQIAEMAQYYVLRNKDTGMYFRGKGVNRWGKYFNQATIYRVKGTAEASVREVAWHGEKAEIVQIQIFENDTGYRKATEVAREIFEEIGKTIQKWGALAEQDNSDYGELTELILCDIVASIAELKKKYVGKDTNVTTKTEGEG